MEGIGEAGGRRPRKRLRRRRRRREADESSSDGNASDGASSGAEAAREAAEAVQRTFGQRDAEKNDEDNDNRNGGGRNRNRTRGPGLLHNEDDDDEEEEEDGEDLLESTERDYRGIAELDRLDTRELDESEYGAISAEARREAEEALALRDKEEKKTARRVRLPGMLAEDSDESDESDEEDERERRRRRARREAYEGAAADGEEGADVEVDTDPIDLQNFDVPLRQFLETEAVQNEVKRRFERFLLEFGSEILGHPKYEEIVDEMCMANTQSLNVSYKDLSRAAPTLAIWLADHPAGMFPLLNAVANKIVFERFAAYENIHDEIFVRICELPILDTLRDLRTIHLNVLVRVRGIVTRRSQVRPMLRKSYFRCTGCDSLLGPVEVVSGVQPLPPLCSTCDEGLGPIPVQDNDASIYRNYQHILLQESPSTVPPGRVPRYKTCFLYSDMVDVARPGEEIEVTGIYRHEVSNHVLNVQQGFPVFSTVIEGNHVKKLEDLGSSMMITDEDRQQLERLARDPKIADRIISSIAPSIYGHRQVKTALALAMFGGRELNVKRKHRIRGDINVLLLGDPGTAKSQCLKYVEKTAPRSVYTTGKGASAVGLTAAVQKDPITKEWVLEGGALVLADRGVCLIDEFDKMNDQDRTSIHEAMEQQSISISKAGIVTTLQARCSVVAAANPLGGRYDPQKSFSEQVALTDPIIQRFDILCVLQDQIDPIADERLAKFVVGSHVSSHPEGCISPEEAQRLTQEHLDGEENPEDDNSEDPLELKNINSFAGIRDVEAGTVDALSQETLRKFILLARTKRPQLERINKDKIVNLYAELRAESMNSGGIPIAVRHMESILRMSEAFARMHLREFVIDVDVDRAIQVMLDSFIGAQKFSVMRQLRRSFQKYTIHGKDNNDLLLFLLDELMKQSQYAMLASEGVEELSIELSALERRAREYNIRDLSHFLKSDVFIQGDFQIQGNRVVRSLTR